MTYFDELQRQSMAISAAMPTLKLALDKWYETLNSAIAATQSFANLVEQFHREENMVLNAWENEGGSFEREVYS